MQGITVPKNFYELFILYFNIYTYIYIYYICCCGPMADLEFIPLVFWHPSTALIVLYSFDPVLGTGGDGLCSLLYFFV
jgi:hypothetical protein